MMVPEVTQRMQIERRLAAQYAVTQILASADSVDDATAQVLGAICLSLDWAWAALWTTSPTATTRVGPSGSARSPTWRH